MFDSNVIIKSIRSVSNKDSNAFKITEYYIALTSGSLDDGGIALFRSKVLNIEKYLLDCIKKHPNDGTIMQPEENAIGLINDLKEKGFLN